MKLPIEKGFFDRNILEVSTLACMQKLAILCDALFSMIRHSSYTKRNYSCH